MQLQKVTPLGGDTASNLGHAKHSRLVEVRILRQNGMDIRNPWPRRQ
jgi:hypothetical protein